MPLNIDFHQILLHLLNFTILFGALYFLLYGPVKKFMAKRDEMYRDLDEQTKAELENAKTANAAAEKRLADCEGEIAEARQKSEADARNEAQAIIEKAKQEAEKILEKARFDAEKEREDLLRSAKQEIASAALQMAEKIAGGNPSDSYDEFIAAAEQGENND